MSVALDEDWRLSKSTSLSACVYALTKRENMCVRVDPGNLLLLSSAADLREMAWAHARSAVRMMRCANLTSSQYLG
jgi:hypothetical protein